MEDRTYIDDVCVQDYPTHLDNRQDRHAGAWHEQPY
jgi:hypothetical protein